MKKRTIRLGLLAAALAVVVLQPGSSNAKVCAGGSVTKVGLTVSIPEACSPIGQPPELVRRVAGQLSDQIEKITHGDVIVDTP